MIPTIPLRQLTPKELKRFHVKVSVGAANECWLWTGALSTAGRGLLLIKDNGKWTNRSAPRLAWLIANGRDPGQMYVCHTCDNPVCVNPAHLFLGTSHDNMQDKVRKGRHENTRKTHCPHGHEYSPENTWRHGTRRHCRACMRRRCVEQRERQRLAKQITGERFEVGA